MDLLSKEEPLINLNGFDSTEEGDDVLTDAHHQRRLSSSRHANMQHRPPPGSKGNNLRKLSSARKEQSMERHDSVIVSAVERTMKSYADSVLRVLEGMSGRLSQLESISQGLELSVTMLRASVEENHEHTDLNFNTLNDGIMEMHRSVQILRDKHDIIEAHTQLEKLQTSKALAEKERSPGLATTDSHLKEEHDLQVESEKVLSQPLSLAPPSSVSSIPSGAPHLLTSQPQSLVNQQYQAPNLQSQPLVPVQHVPNLQHVPNQDASGQMQQISKAHTTPSEQVQYQSLPQQLQVQPMLSSQPPPMLQTQHTLEQGHYHPVPSQMQRPILQGSTQLPLQVTTPQQTEQAHYQSAPQQRQIQLPLPQASVQQPIQPQQGMVSQQQAQQGIVPQQPVHAHQGVVPHQTSHTQHQSSSQLQGLFPYYGQPNDGQSHAALAPSMPTYAQGAYGTEPARDSANFAPQFLPPNPTHQSSLRQNFRQMVLTPSQKFQSLRDSGSFGNVSGPMTWKPQANPGTPNAAPQLQKAQPVRADHPPEVSGIIEKVVAMGFSRDQVQGVIRGLSERNQTIDMNVVLDVLMNGGRGIQGGFSR